MEGPVGGVVREVGGGAAGVDERPLRQRELRPDAAGRRHGLVQRALLESPTLHLLAPHHKWVAFSLRITYVCGRV